LAGDHGASKNLWIFDFDLGIVEDVIVVIDVLDNFDRLLVGFLLRLRGAVPPGVNAAGLLVSSDLRLALHLLLALLLLLILLEGHGFVHLDGAVICVVVGPLHRPLRLGLLLHLLVLVDNLVVVDLII
jgi:hypothetical protein